VQAVKHGEKIYATVSARSVTPSAARATLNGSMAFRSKLSADEIRQWEELVAHMQSLKK
jgi:hypothetical protein